MIVRQATTDDLPAILRMAEQFWAQTDYKVPFKPESAAVMVEACMMQGLCHVLEDNEPVGFVAGVMAPLLGNHDYIVGSELAWWVNPEYRSGRNGFMLMQAIETAAKDAGVHFWNMMNLESVNPEIAEKIYTRAGYAKSESTFLKVF